MKRFGFPGLVAPAVWAVAAAWPGGWARAELKPTKLATPIFVDVTLDEDAKKVTGSLIRFDKDVLWIKDGKGEHEWKWAQLTPASVHAVRARVVDRKSAADLLELAELAMKVGLPEQAKLDVAAAVRADPGARLKGEAILRAPGGATSTVKFKQPTPAEINEAVEVIISMSAETQRLLNVKLELITTRHFLIYTDWDPREYHFLKLQFESAYDAVSQEFEMSPKDSVFVGALPVFMFARHEDFKRYAKTIDLFDVPDAVNGYFAPHKVGGGHMAMWKPAEIGKKYGTAVAEVMWAKTLTHELAHAFVSRYRSNRLIPRWLNEGVAEVISVGRFHFPVYKYAREQAEKGFDFQVLFDSEKMPGGEMYPVMQTMAEYLIKKDKKKFLKLFDDLKEGMEPQQALQKHFSLTYKQFEENWRAYAKGLKD